MDLFPVKMKTKSLPVAVILLVYFSSSTEAHNAAYTLDSRPSYRDVSHHTVPLDHVIQKRAAPELDQSQSSASPQAPSPPAPSPAAPTSTAPAASVPPSDAPASTSSATKVDDSNRTTNLAKPNATTATPTASVTQVPILGANGTGQRWPNATDNVPRVSDPISTDDNFTNFFNETPEKIKAEQNLTSLIVDNHDFYNSSFISDLKFFNDYWSNISTSPTDVHSMLSNSHRRATTVQLKFKFPFYGNWIQNITVAPGFIYTGEHTHLWPSATQYIAPLMANFDTSLNVSSSVKLSDDGEKFTAFWDNVSLRENPDKPFTFAVTLYSNGDIVFAYKIVPLNVSEIDDSQHPVKIGISDAYLTDRVMFYVHRKTIYEYHRVSFKHYEITNNTILKLTALPTCLQYNTCDTCLNHNTSFKCAWCENIKKCSSGTDRNKHDWQLRTLVTNASICPAPSKAEPPKDTSTTYETDTQPHPRHDAVVNTPHNAEYTLDSRPSYRDVSHHTVPLDHVIQKRAAPELDQSQSSASPQAPPPPAPSPAAPTSTAPAASVPPSDAPASTSSATKVDDSNRTTNLAKPNATAATPTASVTQVPILGANGTGQRWPNATDNVPRVSDPISADDNFTNFFNETPEKIKAEQNLTSLIVDNHDFYNSSFISDLKFFNDYWSNISTSPADVHSMLSNSHRRATTVQLKFKFPFYGNWIQNITVATGGFIYTGEHTHAWLAATQYIAPLMANFDTSLNVSSSVKLSDDGEKFTAFWDNVSLRENPDKPFTFAVTLYSNGDIVFAYKNVPLNVSEIDDSQHPVKIGISDAYLTDRVIFYVRRKTIYEYHRVSFKHYEITNNTILKLTALPTCLQYNTCDTCLNHNTSFECAWCENIKKCSSGTDRNKQDWQLRNCDKALVANASTCPAPSKAEPPKDTSTTYETDTQPHPRHDAVVNTLNTTDPQKPLSGGGNATFESPEAHSETVRGGIGGVVAALLAVTLVCSAAAWALYAFKNPHTRSGQMLIKYRPSQWSWRRGEARYTAATIHM